MKFPLLFLNHGGGPLPLLGRQPSIVDHIQSVRKKYLPTELPKLIVVISAHWESDPIRITSSPNPQMYYDYHGFPEESYKYNYPAPGSPTFANKIQKLLDRAGIPSRLDEKRGFDHGVFIPLMLLYPECNIPTVCVSVHGSLEAKANIELGRALAPLIAKEEGVLLLGSGYTFHNMQALFHPSDASYKASLEFNEWLKHTLLNVDCTSSKTHSYIDKLLDWDKAPGALVCHPRAEHLMPLLVVAGAAYESSSMNVPKLIYDTSSSSSHGDDDDDDDDDTASAAAKGTLDKHVVTGYIFSD